MNKFAIVVAIPLFAGYLFAQSESQTTTTTTTTYNGTLVDAACRAGLNPSTTTHTEHRESSTRQNPDESTTTTESTRTTTSTESVQCPVTTTTTTFGLITPAGQYVRFDEPSNTRIVEVVKGNKKWNKYMSERSPIKVHVVGKKHGDVVVLERIR